MVFYLNLQTEGEKMVPKRNLKAKDNDREEKIKAKIKKIRKSNNVIIWNDELVKETMDKYGLSNYKVSDWEEIDLKTKYGNWRIEHDTRMIKLKHENSYTSAFQNDRGSYHLQNVFYDLDFCISSIVSHEEHLETTRFGTK